MTDKQEIIARREEENLPAPYREGRTIEAELDTSVTGAKRTGLIIAFLVFGVFGLWATLAPLDSAAHAPGTVTVRSYKKVIQHLEGGIVADILVQNGDQVEAGDPLLIMDSTKSLAELEIANSQYVALAAKEARLIAERDNLEKVSYPDDLLNGDYKAAVEIAAENGIFEARKRARQGNDEVLGQRIEQLKSQIVGLKSLKATKEELAASYADELEDVRLLLNDGFADKNRLRELERSVASYEGEAAELASSIASTEMQIGETQMQILQYEREFQSEVMHELGETQSMLKDARERITALNDVVARTVVRAPESGVISNLQVHTIGAVLGPGTVIADLVPLADEMIVEARVSPLDIDRVEEGQEASIRFSTFNAQTVPTIYGTVLNVSADALFDEATGASYYLARIAVNADGMEGLAGEALVPGMPAEVFINSGSRTLMQYMLKPLTNVMARSFIED